MQMQKKLADEIIKPKQKKQTKNTNRKDSLILKSTLLNYDSHKEILNFNRVTRNFGGGL